MELHDVPDMKDFFSQQWECYIPFFSDIMSRMRFFRYSGHFMQESLTTRAWCGKHYPLATNLYCCGIFGIQISRVLCAIF